MAGKKKKAKKDGAPVAPEVAAPAQRGMVTVIVLLAALDFAEGGRFIVSYPAGYRVSDTSDELLAWLMKNDPEGNQFVERVEGVEADPAVVEAAEKAVYLADCLRNDAARALIAAVTAQQKRAAAAGVVKAGRAFGAAELHAHRVSC